MLVSVMRRVEEEETMCERCEKGKKIGDPVTLLNGAIGEIVGRYPTDERLDSGLTYVVRFADGRTRTVRFDAADRPYFVVAS